MMAVVSLLTSFIWHDGVHEVADLLDRPLESVGDETSGDGRGREQRGPCDLDFDLASEPLGPVEGLDGEGGSPGRLLDAPPLLRRLEKVVV